MARTDLAGKVIVLTGASSGFGKGAALEFARGRAKVVLAARRDDLLDELANECSAEGGDALACATDVSVRADVERLCTAALEAFGRIDVWINNAGVGALGRFERVPLELHEQVIATNLYGTLYGSYVAYRQFLAQGTGVLINIARGSLFDIPLMFAALGQLALIGVTLYLVMVLVERRLVGDR